MPVLESPLANFNLGLHFVTDESLDFQSLCEVVDSAVAGGVTVVQYRNKKAIEEAFGAEVSRLADIVSGRANFIVNDRLDEVVRLREAGVAIDGVHLGQSDASPLVARELLGPDALIGWTANNAEHAAAAMAFEPGTLDYLGVGIINPTSSKADAPPVLGVSGFANFVGLVDLPCIAIGGVGLSDVPSLLAAGATGVAVISAISRASDPLASAADLADALAAGHSMSQVVE